jgi:hypothetical protein
MLNLKLFYDINGKAGLYWTDNWPISKKEIMMSEFKECFECATKPGMPVLCEQCLWVRKNYHPDAMKATPSDLIRNRYVKRNGSWVKFESDIETTKEIHSTSKDRKCLHPNCDHITMACYDYKLCYQHSPDQRYNVRNKVIFMTEPTFNFSNGFGSLSSKPPEAIYGYCFRKKPHEGPCNGWKTQECTDGESPF